VIQNDCKKAPSPKAYVYRCCTKACNTFLNISTMTEQLWKVYLQMKKKLAFHCMNGDMQSKQQNHIKTLCRLNEW